MLYLNNFINGGGINAFAPLVDPAVDDFGNPIHPLKSMVTGGAGNADPLPSFDTEGATITCIRSSANPNFASHTIYLVSGDSTHPGRFMSAQYMLAELQFDMPNSFVLAGSIPSSEPSKNTWAVGLNFNTGDEPDLGTRWGALVSLKVGSSI